MDRPLARTRKLLLRGLLTVLPLWITFWLVSVLLRFVHVKVTPTVGGILRLLGVEEPGEGLWRFIAPIVGVAALLGLLILAGLLATNLFGRRLLAAFESLVVRIPLVRTIYSSAKQLLDAIAVGKKGAFREVVAFEYPRRGIWVLGFVSSSMPSEALGERSDSELVNVFLPTTPNPTSGFLLIVPAGDLRRLPITVEEGIKMIVSGGLVLPPSLVPPAPGAAE